MKETLLECQGTKLEVLWIENERRFEYTYTNGGVTFVSGKFEDVFLMFCDNLED
jgi:hypothetical protein